MGPCIFCFKNVPEVTFSQEHVIPDNIGGKLVLSDYVCVKCNSDFGKEFDHQILKIPDVFRAIGKLKLPHDNTFQLIKNNFKVCAVLGEKLEVKVRVNGERFELCPQDLPDESRIVSSAEYQKVLHAMCLRDRRLNEAGLTKAQIDERVMTLSYAYNKIKVGEKIECAELGIMLIKRSDPLNVKLKSKGYGDVLRLVAKIAYEFGFMVGGRDFLSSERVSSPLHSFILTGKKQPGVCVIPLSTNYSDFVPVHFIRFEADEYMTRVLVGFFGSIAYALIAPPFEYKVLKQLGESLSCPDLIGVEYQQDLQQDTISFWALLPENNIKCVGFHKSNLCQKS